MRQFVFFLPTLVSLGFAAAFLLSLSGCCRGPGCFTDGVGGGQDIVTIDLPFVADYESVCVQGVNGSYSHRYTSTRYDADFDTPNNMDVPLYAPEGGVVYVHDDLSSGFGRHINLDLGDGTYIVMAHMAEIFADDQSEVAAGQLLGYEGTTGNSTGDHVHIGRHDGDPALDAGEGESIEGLAFRTEDGEFAVTELACSLTNGASYASSLRTAQWHPDGSLVKTPDSAAVYLVEDGALRTFFDEDAFFSRGYSFGDVALIDENEANCYAIGANVTFTNEIGAAYSDGQVWLVFAGDRERQRVSTTGWQAVLKSYGIIAATYDDLPTVDDLETYDTVGSEADFRDGALVSELSSSTVYAISDGIAMPIETWDVHLLMGFEDRQVLEVDDGLVSAVMERVGSCTTNTYCVSWEDVVTCGGPPAEEEGSFSSDSSDETSVDNTGFQLTWTTPGGVVADRIALSGEYSYALGGSSGWQSLVEATGLAAVSYGVLDPSSGDALRFSVEYTLSGGTTWSCLAPYPPGSVQGSVNASFNGEPLVVTAADDPSSDGCGLVVSIP